MDKLTNFIEQKMNLTAEDLKLLEELFIPESIPAKTMIIKAGKTTNYLYFLSEGIVKGCENSNGKIIIKHLVDDNRFFTSIDSFFNETPSSNYFKTITNCNVLKISKQNFNKLKQAGQKWNQFVESLTSNTIRCKMERLNDFQTLSAKERYLKFVKESPNLALNVPVETIASFLGVEAQSLSRIRSQVFS